MEWQDLFAALALVLVLEGMLPFLNPRRHRAIMQTIAQLSDRALRLIGLGSMLVGILMLYLVRI